MASDPHLLADATFVVEKTPPLTANIHRSRLHRPGRRRPARLPLGVSVPTLYRWVPAAGATEAPKK